MMSLVDPHAEIAHEPLSKFVCTIGPSSNSTQAIESLMEAGMSVALIKSSLMSIDDILQTVINIREAANTYSAHMNTLFPLAIAMELKGQTIHTGRLHGGGAVNILEDRDFILTTNEDWKEKGTSQKVFIDCPQKAEEIDQGTEIKIDFGKIVLAVNYITDDEDIVCIVIKGGTLYENRTVQLTGIHFPFSKLTEKDEEDIELATNLSLDYLFVPCVRSESLLEEIRTFLERRHSGLLIVAKFQNKLINDNMESIVKQTDAVVFDRKALSAEMTGERIVTAMDNTCFICKKLGKPVLVEGAILSSMWSGMDPNLLEVQDIVTCQRIGFDGFVLGDVTASGSNPVKCLKELVTICCHAEPSFWQSHSFQRINSLTPQLAVDPAHAISMSVVETCTRISASAIVVVSTSGLSARLISRYLPRKPVIAVTIHARAARQLALWKAVIAYHYVAPEVKDWQSDIDLRLQAGIDLGKAKFLIQPGDPVVLLSNSRPGTGFTNTMRVFYASQADPWINVFNAPSSAIKQTTNKCQEMTLVELIQNCPYLFETNCFKGPEEEELTAEVF